MSSYNNWKSSGLSTISPNVMLSLFFFSFLWENMKWIKMTIKSIGLTSENHILVKVWHGTRWIETIYFALHDFRLLYCLCVSFASHLCLHLFLSSLFSSLTFSMGTNNMADGVPTYFMLIYPRTKHVLVVKDHERKSARPLQCLSAISKLSGNLFVYKLELASLIVLDILFLFSLMIFRGVRWKLKASFLVSLLAHHKIVSTITVVVF